jgi:hypothetical protein
MSGTNFVFDVAKGKFPEKVADVATNIGVLILISTGLEADATMIRRTTLTDLKSASTEATLGGYARKTGITGTVTINDGGSSDATTITIPNQTWTGITAGETWAKLITFYEEAAADGTRIPMTAHSFDVTPNGADITAQFGTGAAGAPYKAV